MIENQNAEQEVFEEEQVEIEVTEDVVESEDSGDELENYTKSVSKRITS